MKILSNDFYKKMFALGGFWNLGIGFTGLLFTDFAVGLFFEPGVNAETFLGSMMLKIVMLAVIIFGIGYLMVARSIEHNRGLVWLGILSKLILFCFFLWYFIMGKTAILGFLTLCGDFLWSVLFLLFLRQTSGDLEVNTFIG